VRSRRRDSITNRVCRTGRARRQLEVLRAYIKAGSVAAAAYELGIGETTVRQHLSGLYRRTGCVNAAQAACSLEVCQPTGHLAGYALL
jgi:DNA-binding NarL/FixJ family response regulator